MSNIPILFASILIQQAEIVAEPSILDMLWLFKTRTREIPGDSDSKVELSPTPKPPILAGVPVTDVQQLTGHHSPARLLLNLAGQGLQQRLAWIDVATDDVPAARKQDPIPTSTMNKHLAGLIADQRSDDALTPVLLSLSLENF